LGERYQLPSVVVWSGDREREWAETIVARSGGRAIMGPATSLPELAAWMRRARMYLGSDTGPMHIAAAVGTPCVALFGPTLPADCGPYGGQHITVQKGQPPEDRRLRRHGPNDAMKKIDTDSVIDACERLLRIGPHQQSKVA
jgi:ADP-heptose:LPS heptosyltransferase